MFSRLKHVAQRVAHRLCLTRQSRRVRPWFAINGDQTLRLEYPLSSESLVFDLGGYRGDFAEAIRSRHGCSVHVFEPVPSFFASIEKRFQHDPNVEVFAFGLSDRRSTATIQVDSDRSSVIKDTRGDSAGQEILLECISDFFDEHDIDFVDLMKINIEGAEYDLLEHVLDQGLHKRIGNFQIQFHAFVDNGEACMTRIQQRLEETHDLTWQYRFVWENWKLRSEP